MTPLTIEELLNKKYEGIDFTNTETLLDLYDENFDLRQTPILLNLKISNPSYVEIEIKEGEKLTNYLLEILSRIDSFQYLDINDYAKIITDEIVKKAVYSLSHHEQIRRAVKESLTIGIYKEYEKKLHYIVQGNERINNNDLDFDLVDFLYKKEQIRENTEMFDIHTGFDDLDVFLRSYVPNILKVSDLLKVENFFSIKNIPGEEKNYNHNNPEQAQNSILPMFNLQIGKNYSSYKDNLEDYIFFKSNFMLVSLSKNPDEKLEFHFTPLNYTTPDVDKNSSLALLIAGFENLFYALENGMFGEYAPFLDKLYNYTNAKQAVILMKMGFDVNSKGRTFKSPEEIIKHQSINPYDDYFVTGEIEKIKRIIRSERFQRIGQRLKENFNEEILNPQNYNTIY